MNGITQYQSRIFRVERLDYETASGKSVSKDVVRHPGSVAILPILDDGRFCLIRNRRVTVGRTLVEIPAGTLEPPETPLKCAHRELAEETGFRARQLTHVKSFYPAPGILDEEMHLFEARQLESGATEHQVDEEIENLTVTVDEVDSMIRSGEICDAKTILAILLYQQSLNATS